MSNVKKYSNFTEEEKEEEQVLWIKHLDTYCEADDLGCRPCDYGMPCDSCHYDFELQRKYTLDLIANKLPITPDMHKYLEM